jgi:hypothetical protein
MPRCTGCQRCVRTVARTSPRCWESGWTVPCTSAPAQTSAKPRISRATPHCVLTTGCNRLDGLDLAVEGDAAKVSDLAELRSVADTFESKYGAHFTAPEGTWSGLGDAIRRDEALVLRVAPLTAFGFGKGTPYSQTRWDFG